MSCNLFMFATRFLFLITKASLKLRKNKTMNYAIYFLKIYVKNYNGCKDPDEVISNFSSCNLNDHEKSVLCKGLNFAVPPKAIEHLEFLPPFETLFREITSFDIGYFNKECVKSILQHRAYSSFKQLSKISDRNLSREKVKVQNDVAKNRDLVIQKTGKGNNIVILNRSD